MHNIILNVSLLFLFLPRNTIGNECTDMRFLENRYTCPSGEQEFFPVKGSCILFIKCIPHSPDVIDPEVSLPIMKCLTGMIFDGTKCVQVNDSTDFHNCPQQRCFPPDSRPNDGRDREYERVEAIHRSHKQIVQVSSSRESDSFIQVDQSGATARSSLISFSKIVISVFLVDFIFVICIL